MTELPHWQKALVCQRRPKTGCVTTGFEYLIRYANICNPSFIQDNNVDLEHFQDQFDFDYNKKNNEPMENNFTRIADAVKSELNIDIEHKKFDSGHDKVKCLEQFMGQGVPCIMSFQYQWGKHIVPVIAVDDKCVKVILYVQEDQQPKIICHSRESIEKQHDKLNAQDLCNEIAWLK